MSYEPGKMGIAEGMALVFFTCFSSVFLTIWSMHIEGVGTAAWSVPIIGALCFVVMFGIVLFVMDRVPGDLYSIAEKLLGKTGAVLITLYFAMVFLSRATFLLRQFCENTLLTALPDAEMSEVIGWYSLMISVAIWIGIEALARTCFVSFPFGVVGLFIIMPMVYHKFDFYNLMPWLGNGLPGVLKTGFISTSDYIYVFLLPILASAFSERKIIRTAGLIGIGLAALLRAVIFFVYIGVFSVTVGKEKILPFFEISRLIYISRFLQRIESFFIIVWAIYGMATVAINLYVALYLLVRLFHLPTMRPLIVPMTVIMIQLALLPSDIATTIDLNTEVAERAVNFGVFAIPVILLVAALVKGKRGGKRCIIK